LGFHNVTALAHGDRHLWGDVVVEAYVGAPTGPTTRENGYIVRDRAAGESFYYEPHGYPDPNLKHSDPVDLLLVPTVDLRIPLLGPVIQGSQAALQTVQWLRPRAIAPTAAGGELRYEGFLLQLLRMEGDGSTLGTLLRQHQLTLEILEPKPWERFEVRGAQKTPA
jgi:L-ascorbate metabolism protein UlaG (beta-lactamase superfamily)